MESKLIPVLYRAQGCNFRAEIGAKNAHGATSTERKTVFSPPQLIVLPQDLQLYNMSNEALEEPVCFLKCVSKWGKRTNGTETKISSSK